MKVTYLRLKNFNAIHSSLNRKTIEIDFTKMEHSILLLVGTNGSCKTYILSNIHPFAFVGNVDIRSGQDMIIDGKDGEKEIHFRKGEDLYKIRHFYIYQKKGRKIKSFIEKNGVEMNSSGLVTTFNEIIGIEFGIDISFLKVIRLGSNVNNIVAMKSTERKESAVKLLTEVDEYIADFKRATEKVRGIKTALKNVVEKIKRLNIGDEVLYRNEMLSLEETLNSINALREKEMQEFFKYKGSVESKMSGSPEELSKLIDSVAIKFTSVSSDITLLKHQRNEQVILGNPDKILLSNEKSLKEMEKEIAVRSTKIEMLSKSVSSLESEKMDLENQMKTLHIINDIENIQKDLDFAYGFRKKYQKYYENFTAPCSVDDLRRDYAVMQNIADMVRSLREFPSEAIKMYYEAEGKKRSPRDICTAKLIKLSTELSMCEDTMGSDLKIDQAPQGCVLRKECIYYNAFHSNRPRREIENEVETVRSCLKVADGFYNIDLILKSRGVNLPYKVERAKILVDVLNGSETFFDFQEGVNRIAFLEKYGEYLENEKSIEQYEKDIAVYEKQKASIDSSIMERLNRVVVDLSDAEKKLEKERRKRKRIVSESEELAEYIDSLKETIRINGEIEVKTKELNALGDELAKYRNDIDLIREYREAKITYEEKMDSFDMEIKKTRDSIYQHKVVLREFDVLTKEKEDLDANYEITNLIQNAVSSTRGIPLLYLNVHFGRARNIANRIISAVYGDSISLGSFIINEKEFRIPYTKNGTEVEDVQQASQGEVSVISLALSFALIEEFSGAHGYNILLLDEVDGPLDKGNKEKFLRVLEAQMERIGSEQVFMITHNQLFENYPVDVFITHDKDGAIDSYKSVNVINQ